MAMTWGGKFEILEKKEKECKKKLPGINYWRGKKMWMRLSCFTPALLCSRTCKAFSICNSRGPKCMFWRCPLWGDTIQKGTGLQCGLFQGQASIISSQDSLINSVNFIIWLRVDAFDSDPIFFPSPHLSLSFLGLFFFLLLDKKKKKKNTAMLRAKQQQVFPTVMKEISEIWVRKMALLCNSEVVSWKWSWTN